MVSDGLFGPVRLGPYLLKNRIVMSPMTRHRSPGYVPNGMNAEYYTQRASAGLVIAESTAISERALGGIDTPGIYSTEQIRGWREVTDAVHGRGGRIYLQLWHAGRCSHISVLPDGQAPMAPSAVPSRSKSRTVHGRVQHSPPRAIEPHEFPGIVQEYRRATENAMEAGFDGVEVHAANGYLLDQFLRESTNRREDAYGGSAENRSRMIWEVVRAVAEVCGRERVGVRISPTNSHHDMWDSDPEQLFFTLAAGLSEIGIGYLHVVEGATPVGAVQLPFDYPRLRSLFRRTYIANNGYTLARAQQALAEGHADLFSFGRRYIANPDLVERLRIGAPMNAIHEEGLYDGGTRGYTDYPFLTAAAN